MLVIGEPRLNRLNHDRICEFLHEIEANHRLDNISELPHGDLIRSVMDRWWLMYQCIRKILSKAQNLQRHHDTTMDLMDSRTHNDWIALYTIHPDIRPILQLEKWNNEFIQLHREMNLRLIDKPVASALLRWEGLLPSSFSQSELRQVLVRLIVRRSDRRSYLPEYYGQTEIEDTAISELFRIRKKLRENSNLTMHLQPPPFPKGLGLPTKYHYKNFYPVLARKVVNDYLPCLEKSFEKYRAKPGWTSPLLKEFFRKQGYQKIVDSDDYECQTKLFYGNLEFLERQFNEHYPENLAKQLTEVMRKIRREDTRNKILTALQYCLNRRTEAQACMLADITPKTFRNHIPRSIRTYLLRQSLKRKPFYRKPVFAMVS